MMKRIGHSLLNIALTVNIITSSCTVGKMEASEKDPDISPSKCVMKFERIGGYFGTYDGFRIYTDGRVLNSAGKTARIPPYLVTRWTEAIVPGTVPNLREKPSSQWLAMDCYTYRITVYDKKKTRVFSLHCTDTYPLDKNGDISFIDLGRIRDTLMSLSWK